jgi:hypothetical protein
MRQQLEHLLDRRQAKVNETGPSRRRVLAESAGEAEEGTGTRFYTLSAADADQLEQRRLELEQQRFELVNVLRNRQLELKNLRSERAEVERQRAALLSARSIEHVQRDLAEVQRKLETAAYAGSANIESEAWRDSTARASDFLAQLSDGRLVRLELQSDARQAWAIRQSGERVPFHLLSSVESDQVRLSFSLAIATAVARQGVQLPLLLDEPFLHAEHPRDTAAIGAVLEAFGRQGHQVLVFTGDADGGERLSSLGAKVYDLVQLRRWRSPLAAQPAEIQPVPPVVDVAVEAQRRVRPIAQRRTSLDETDAETSSMATSPRRMVGKKRSPNGKVGSGGRDAA